MTELVDIQRVEIGPENLLAFVRIADDAPLMTSEDLEGTARVYRLLPHIVDHVCLGDAGETFRDAMGNTEIAHLLEHVTVELLAQTNLAGDVSAGRTWVDEVEPRTFEIELACPDDVLVCAALSCGVWILDWAYRGGGDPEPDIEAIVGGLVSLVESVEGQGEDLVVDYVPDEFDEEDGWSEDEDESFEEDFSADDPQDDDLPEPEADETAPEEPAAPVPAPQPEPEPAPEPAPVPEDRPLWTPAPTVEPVRRTPVAQPSAPEVEAEVDEIMATIEMAPITGANAEDNK